MQRCPSRCAETVLRSRVALVPEGVGLLRHWDEVSGVGGGKR